MQLQIFLTNVAKPIITFRQDEDVEKNQIKYFSKKVANIKCFKYLIMCVHVRKMLYGDFLGLLYIHI